MSQLGIGTDVINTWPYYEFEEYIKLLNEKNEKEKQENDASKNNSKMPNSNFKMPNFKMPSMPKL
jgi:hypothetical protein